jgi:6-pyruvoyltetrahydropterin/6-carboxytetrahydropterin synthase
MFRFEAAHAIHHYPGSCAHIHGHSYELHVTVKAKASSENFIDGIGIVMDFKNLKSIVQDHAIQLLDHKLILSKIYLAESKNDFTKDELLVFEVEPTAENLLLFLKRKILPELPHDIQLKSLKLWETRDSYAEWSAG